jgi:predicted metal-binding protein
MKKNLLNNGGPCMAIRFEKPERVRQVPPHIDPEQLKRDLEVLRNKARNAGSADTAIISAADVVFNPEVKARVDADDGYPSIHWPLDYPKDNVEEAVRAFQSGVFFRVKVIDPHMPNYGGGPISNPAHRQNYLQVYEIVTLLESASFYMAYHLALGFPTGNCRSIFCADEKRCRPMLKGRVCIHPYKGRPSMEAAGIDAAAMAKKLKWELPGGEAVPLLAGLVMVA